MGVQILHGKGQIFGGEIGWHSGDWGSATRGGDVACSQTTLGNHVIIIIVSRLHCQHDKHRCGLQSRTQCAVYVCLLGPWLSSVQKDWTYQWHVDSFGPKKPRIRWEPKSPKGKCNFDGEGERGDVLARCIVPLYVCLRSSGTEAVQCLPAWRAQWTSVFDAMRGDKICVWVWIAVHTWR